MAQSNLLVNQPNQTILGTPSSSPAVFLTVGRCGIVADPDPLAAPYSALMFARMSCGQLAPSSSNEGLGDAECDDFEETTEALRASADSQRRMIGGGSV